LKFELWEALDLKSDKSINLQADYLADALFDELLITNVRVDDEGIFKAVVIIDTLEDLLKLSPILKDDIVIYGLDSDLIMSKRTMKELGLD